jgi:hypothetical protein
MTATKSKTITQQEYQHLLSKLDDYRRIVRLTAALMDKPPVKDDYDKLSVFHEDYGRWTIIKVLRDMYLEREGKTPEEHPR